MITMTASQARAKLYRLMDSVALSHEPVQIAGKRTCAILVSKEDWSAIQETLHLLSVPGMRKSIQRGLRTPVSLCKDRPGW